jgi:2-oxoglutarate ferredoxin oxidoreductase subunit delta
LKKNIVKIDIEKCKECGLCIVECKLKILALSNEVNKSGYHPVKVVTPEKCTGCTLCAIACPEAIIEIERIEE